MGFQHVTDQDEIMSLTNSTTRGLEVKPFLYSFVHDESFVAQPNVVEFRHSLPMRISVLVERKLGDHLVVSDPAANSLRQKQLRFRKLFDKVEPKKADPKDVIPGRDLLLHNKDDEVFRVRVHKPENSVVDVLLIDFNIVHRVHTQSLYEMPEQFVEGADKFAFAGRINLLPHVVTQPLGLPQGNLICLGDLIEVVIMTAVEPHLAVFGFSQSISRGIAVERALGGFTEQDAANWIEFVRGGSLQPTAVSLPLGFGRLQKRDRHDNRLAIVVNVEALDCVCVRDVDSCIRLSTLKDRLHDLYSDTKFVQSLKYQNVDEMSSGMGCVAEHPISQLFYRVEVVGFGDEHKVHVRAVDHPELPGFSVSVGAIFHPISALNFPREVFTVAMTRHSKSLLRFHLSQLAACLIPTGTPVVLRTDPRNGLTTIFGANALNGVLETIGFFKLGEHSDEMYDPTTTMSGGFGCAPVVHLRGPESVDSLTSSRIVRKNSISSQNSGNTW